MKKIPIILLLAMAGVITGCSDAVQQKGCYLHNS